MIPEVVAQVGKPEVLGLMRIKNEAEWIEKSLESQLGYWEGSGICDKILVLDDHSTDETRDICRSFGDRVVLIESQFQGPNEGRDKRYLLQYAIAADPQWVVWIDGDEVLERDAAATLRREFMRTDVGVYAMQMLYFWDEPHLVRVDGIYAFFTKYVAFRVRGQNTGAFFIPTGSGEADIHNGGNSPHGTSGKRAVSAAKIKHYGYMHGDQRQRKYEFYNRVDPDNEFEDRYRHIIETPGARHAPGPVMLMKYTEP